MSEEQKFYDMKSELTTLLCEFWSLCTLDGRNPKEEIDDCLADAEKECK